MDHLSSLQMDNSTPIPPEAMVTTPPGQLPHATVLQNQWNPPPAAYHDYSNSSFLNAAPSTSMSMGMPGGSQMMMSHPMLGPYGQNVGMEIGGSSEDYELQPDGTSTKRKLSASLAPPSNALRAAAAYLAVAKAKRQKLTADRNGQIHKPKWKGKRKALPPPIPAALPPSTAQAGGHQIVPTNVDQVMENAKRNDAGPMPPLLRLPAVPDYTSYSDSPYNTTLPGFDTTSNDIPISYESSARSVSPVASSSDVVYNPVFLPPAFLPPDDRSFTDDFATFPAYIAPPPNPFSAPIASGSNGIYNPPFPPFVNHPIPNVVAVPQAPAKPIPKPAPPRVPYKSPSSSPLSSSSSGRGSTYQSADAPLDQIFQFRESMFSLVPGTWVCGFCDRSVDPHANLYTYRPALEKNHGFTAVGNEEVGTHLKSCDAVGEDRTRLMKEWRVGVKARKVQQLKYIAEQTKGDAATVDETRRGALTGKVGGAALLTHPVEEKVVEEVVKVKKMAKGWKAAALASNEPVVKKPGRPQSKAIAKREAAAKLLEMENGGEGEGASAGAARLAAKRKAAAAASASGTVKKIIMAGKLKAAKKPKSHSSSSDLGLSTPNFDVVIKSEWTSFLSVVHRTTAAAPTSLIRPLLVMRSTDIHSSTTLHRFRLPTMQSRPVDGLLTVNVQFFDSHQRPTTAIEQNVLLALGDGQLRLEVIDEKLHWSVRRGKVRLIEPEEMEA